MSKTKIALSILLAMQVPIIAWLSGYDFDVRDSKAATCYFISLILFVWAMFFPE